MAVEDSWFRVDKETGKKVSTKRHGRGKRWRVRNPGAPTRSFEKKSPAEAYDTAVKADLLKGVTPFDHTAGRVLFSDYGRRVLKERHYTGTGRETVMSRLETWIVPAFEGKQMREVRPSTVKSWLAELRTKLSKYTGQPLAAVTVARIYDVLAVIMDTAHKDRVIGENPLANIKYPAPPKIRRVIQVWEQTTVNTLLAGVPDRHHAIPLLAATCGHRQGEAFAVAVEDIDFLKRREITIRHQVQRVNQQWALVPPKGEKVRVVPLAKTPAEALSAHIARYGTTPLPCACHPGMTWRVLFAQDGQLLADRKWNPEVWHPAVTAARMTPSRATGLHQLRHFYASTLIEGGASPKQVQEYLGHASITITMDIYGHLFEKSHDKARAIVDAAFTPNDAQPLSSASNAGVYPVRTEKIN